MKSLISSMQLGGNTTVWVSGTVHSCLCYSPRVLKARSICTHFEEKVLLCDLIVYSRLNLAVLTSVDRWSAYLCGKNFIMSGINVWTLFSSLKHMACYCLMQFIRTKWTAETLKRGLEPEQSVVLFCNNKRFYGVTCISLCVTMVVKTNVSELKFCICIWPTACYIFLKSKSFISSIFSPKAPKSILPRACVGDQGKM